MLQCACRSRERRQCLSEPAALLRPSLPSGYRGSGGESKVLRCAGCCAECLFLGHLLCSVCSQPLWACSQTLSCHWHIARHPKMAFPFGKAALKQGHRLNCQGSVPHPQTDIAAGVPSPYVMLVSSGALCCTETLGMLCTCAAVDTHLFFLLVGIVCVRCSLCLLRHICRESQHLCAITSLAFSLP